jgi:hypothetical protein
MARHVARARRAIWAARAAMDPAAPNEVDPAREDEVDPELGVTPAAVGELVVSRPSGSDAGEPVEIIADAHRDARSAIERSLVGTSADSANPTESLIGKGLSGPPSVETSGLPCSAGDSGD